MKILWVGTGFLHPTVRGGQIRTLEMLKQLHRRHEIHFAALADPRQPEGPARSAEYCVRAYPVTFRNPQPRSPLFWCQLARGLASPLPTAVFRWRSARMRGLLTRLLEQERFDHVVCDFLTPAVNLPRHHECILFQHNVEMLIWRRLAENAPTPLRRAYFRMQAARMSRFEGRICRSVRHVVAVSETDAALMHSLYGLERVSIVPTGVDVGFFTPPEPPPPLTTDLIFVGSMNYLPNIDAVEYFVREILPQIRRRRPACTLTVAGWDPDPAIRVLAKTDPRIRVTGAVPDIRPYVWESAVAIVPLRCGSGTRLKIYESMAARRAVVSTTIGTEGLTLHPPSDIRLADTPEAFADACLQLLENPAERQAVAEAGWQLVSSRFSWAEAARRFEEVLEQYPAPH